MNLFFYLGIERIDLGKSVAIEFLGPIAVAAATTRTMRNAGALLLAVAGVVTLGGVELDDNALGVFFILLSSAMWALYIVVGSRVAQVRPGVAGLGVALAIGTVAITPVGAPNSGPVWTSATLLLLCCATGVFSNAIGYGIDQYVLRRIPVRRFSVLLALLPVTALVVGWVALDQRPSALDLVGHAGRARRRRPAGPRRDPRPRARTELMPGRAQRSRAGWSWRGSAETPAHAEPAADQLGDADPACGAVVVLVVMTWSR